MEKVTSRLIYNELCRGFAVPRLQRNKKRGGKKTKSQNMKSASAEGIKRCSSPASESWAECFLAAVLAEPALLSAGLKWLNKGSGFPFFWGVNSSSGAPAALVLVEKARELQRRENVTGVDKMWSEMRRVRREAGLGTDAAFPCEPVSQTTAGTDMFPLWCRERCVIRPNMKMR